VAKSITKIPKKIPGIDVASVITSMLDTIKEVKRIKETEETKRVAIIHETKVQLEKIRSEKEILIKYFELSFNERENNFNQLFKALDKAIDKGKIETIEMTLSVIQKTIETNPISNYKEFRNNLLDSSKELEI